MVFNMEPTAFQICIPQGVAYRADACFLSYQDIEDLCITITECIPEAVRDKTPIIFIHYGTFYSADVFLKKLMQSELHDHEARELEIMGTVHGLFQEQGT